MLIKFRIIAMLALGFLFVTRVHAQVATGTPPFGSFGGSPDTVDLANLNAHWSIPVLHKPGRGTNFTYDISYDTSVWYPEGASGSQVWTPVYNWGWRGVTEVEAGYISYSLNIYDCVYYIGKVQYQGYEEDTYSNFVYHDPWGIPHPFTGVAVVYIGGSAGSCKVGQNRTISATATDGSGLTMYGDENAGTNTITTPKGKVLSPPFGTGTGVAQAVDRNGNIISANSSGQFFDALNSTTQVLTVAGSGTPSSPKTFSYTAPSGATATYTMKFTSFNLRTNFACSGVTDYGTNGTTTANLVTEIDLPDYSINPNSKYSFTYERTPGYSASVTGRIATVTLPTGGTITHTYTGGNNGITCSDGSTSGLERYTPDSGSNYWNYSRNAGTGAAYTTTITDPLGNNTVVQFQGLYETQRQSYQGAVSSANLLRTLYTCYNGANYPCNSTAITLPITQRVITTVLAGTSNLTSQTKTLYNSTGSLTEQDDYDYGQNAPGSLLKKTAITYAALTKISAFRQQVTVTNGSGATVSQTNFNYGDTVTTTSGTPQHTTPAGSRGNLLSVNYYVNGSTYLTKSYSYFDTGNVQTSTDVNGAQTTYTYGACGNSFPTGISEPLGLARSMGWNCTGGVQTSITDENGNVSSTSYTRDPYFWRPESATDPTNAVTSFTYTGETQMESVLPIASGSSASDLLVTSDSQGRSSLSQVREGPGVSTFDTVETDYDSDSRPYRVALPFQANAGQTSSTAPSKTTSYDALGRVTGVTDSGGGTITNGFSQNDVLVTRGPAPAGENLKKHQSEYDGLGRLTSVCEITSLPGSGTCGQTSPQTGYWTKYSYDALGHLVGVTQNAQSSGPQTRAYVYDLMGRLTSETNPESGTTTYYYDTVPAGCYSFGDNQSGNLEGRKDANGNLDCFHYDALHRLGSVGTQNAPPNYAYCKRFQYDAANNGVNGSAPSGVTVNNVKGRLVEAETDNCGAWPPTPITDEWFSYTPRGQVSDVWESTPHSGGYYHAAATYWANGALNELNGSAGGYTTSYSLDGEGRIYSTASAQALASTSYNPSSLPTQVNFGSGDSDTFKYDPNTNRMTQYQYNVNGQFVSGNLVWNANGTLGGLGIIDPFNSTNAQNCNYAHDDLVRIASANCQGNLLSNPSFEQGTTGYTVGGTVQVITNSQQAHSGNNYLQLTASANGSTQVWGPEINVSPGAQITFGGWAFLQSGSNNCCQGWWLAVYDSNNNAIAYVGGNPAPSYSGWTYQSATYTVPSNGAHVQLYAQVWNPTATTVLWVDDGFLNTNSVWSQTFSYDAFGNIVKNGTSSFQAVYSSATNRMTQISGSAPNYDPDGNVTNDFLHTYTWDAFGRPVNIDGVGLTLDAQGRVVELNKSGAYTQFLYSPTGFKMQILNGQVQIKSFVPLPAGALAEYNNSGTIAWRHSDWLGSSRLTSTPSRTVSYDGAYGPFGELYAQSGTTDVSFTGMDQDTVANLYDFPAREYGIQGRWPSPDPSGMTAFHLTDPQSLNRYAYARNTPLSVFDPTGLNEMCQPGDFTCDPFTASGNAGNCADIMCTVNSSGVGSSSGVGNAPSAGDQGNNGQGCGANDASCGPPSDGSQHCNIDQNFCGTFDCNLEDQSCSVDAGSLCIDNSGNQTTCEDHAPRDPNGTCTDTTGLGLGDVPCGAPDEIESTPPASPLVQQNTTPGVTQDLVTMLEIQERVEFSMTNRILIPGAMIVGGITVAGSAGLVTVQTCLESGGFACGAVVSGTGPAFVGGLWLAGQGAYYAVFGKLYGSGRP